MISYKALQLLLLVSSMTPHVIGMMPQGISPKPPKRVSSLPFKVEGIAQKIEELPKELRYGILSSALELRENPKYKIYRQLDVGSYFRAIALTTDNTRALTVSYDGVAHLWDVENGKLLKGLKGHTGLISSVALSADGKIALTGSDDGTARVWTTLAGELVRAIQIGTPVRSVALSADGSRALTGGFNGIARFYNTSSGELLRELKGHTGIISSVALSADGNIALTGSDYGTARVWTTFAGKLVRTIKIELRVPSVTLSADGTIAVIQTKKNQALIVDVKTGALLNTLLTKSSFGIYSIALSKDGKRALTGTHEGDIQVWNTKPLSGQKKKNTPLTVLEGHLRTVTAVAFGGDDFIASGANNGVALIWKPYALEQHYWPLKEGKVDWGAFTDQEKAAWQTYRGIFSRPRLCSPNEKSEFKR